MNDVINGIIQVGIELAVLLMGIAYIKKLIRNAIEEHLFKYHADDLKNEKRER